MPAAWLVRAGRHGEREDVALSESLVIAGWEELGDIGSAQSKEDLRELVSQAYPEDGKALIANWTGQLWRFLAVIDMRDYVAMPLKTRSAVAIGRVAGPYEYRVDAGAGFRHVRRVEWIRTDVPRTAIKQDLLDSMGSLLTICGLTRFDAEQRIAYLAEYGIDPGPGGEEPDGLEATAQSEELPSKAAARNGSAPVQITIRALLARWGATRRVPGVVAAIESDLADKGLTTRPPFTEGWIENQIELVPVGEEPTAGQAGTSSQVADDTEDVSELPPVMLRVGDLESANRRVSSITPEDSL